MSKAGAVLQIIRFDGRAFHLRASERFVTALFASLMLHATFIYSAYFQVPNPKPFKSNQSVLDVVLVNSKSQDRPRDAKVEAQTNLDGGGNTDAKRRAKSPLPTLQDKITELEESMAKMMEAARLPTQESARVLTTPQSNQRVPQQPTALADDAAADSEQVSREHPSPLQSALANQVRQRTRQIANLEAQISKDYQAYQQRPRRKFIGASAAEYRFAGYVEDWRVTIEKVGNENYPEAARRLKLYGSLLITVAIRANGSLENIEIPRSSGNKILDAAAIHIVELAAPYPRFPQQLRDEADVLHITRTWTFSRADQLVSE